MSVRAVLLDFNGTLSRDEPVLERLFREVLAEEGVALDARTYYEELAGLSDPEIVEAALERAGRRDPDLAARLLRRKVARYKEVVAVEPTIEPGAIAAVRELAARGPVAIVSGAPREEIEHQLRLHRLHDGIALVVAAEDVARGKPDPEGYVRGLAGLRERGHDLRPGDCLAVEDSPAGVAAARAAGMRCVAVRGTVDPARLVGAEAVVDRLGPGLLTALGEGVT